MRLHRFLLVLCVYLGWALPLPAQEPKPFRVIAPKKKGMGDVLKIIFTADGKLVAAHHHHSVAVWEVATGNFKGSLGLKDPANNHAFGFSPNGQMLAVADGLRVKLWDVAAQKERTLEGFDNRVDAVLFSANGKILATSSGETIKLWDVATLKREKTIRSIRGTPLSFANEDKTIVVSSGPAGFLLQLLDVARDKVQEFCSDQQSVALSPVGKLLATGSRAESVRFWDVGTGKAAGDRIDLDGSVKLLTFRADGKSLVAVIVVADKSIEAKLLEVASRKASAILKIQPKVTETQPIDLLVIAMGLSADGRLLAVPLHGKDNTSSFALYDLAPDTKK